MTNSHDTENEALETQEWIDSLDGVLSEAGPERVRHLLQQLEIHAQMQGVKIPFSANTPYVNTISVDRAAALSRQSGNRAPHQEHHSLERDVDGGTSQPGIRRYRWAHLDIRFRRDTLRGGVQSLLSRSKRESSGRPDLCSGSCGPGHLRSCISRRPDCRRRSWRISAASYGQVAGCLPYPHPWLMPDFWRFPTVSMGLGPIMSIYHARFIRYLEDRGLKEPSDQKIWTFMGDGETDEPESLGAITLAPRENLDNLVFVINCNLQRLDGPVRGNSRIVQELEAAFRGAGWNVVKVLWGDAWDPLFAKGRKGAAREAHAGSLSTATTRSTRFHPVPIFVSTSSASTPRHTNS